MLYTLEPVEPLLTDTSIIRTLLYHEKVIISQRNQSLYIICTCITLKPPKYGHLYYGQFTYSKRNQNLYHLYLYYTETYIVRTLLSMLRTVHFVPEKPKLVYYFYTQLWPFGVRVKEIPLR